MPVQAPEPQTFTAGASASGYFYQCRIALWLLLRKLRNGDLDVSASVEMFDDVAFDQGGTPLELIQTKHRMQRTADLGDKSADVWKTLRTWAEPLAAGTHASTGLSRLLLTTGCAASGTAMAALRDSPNRDPLEAERLLLKAGREMTGETLAAARAAFLALSPSNRATLVGSIFVLDNQPNIADLDRSIEIELGFPARPELVPAFRQRLEGWWFSEVVQMLSARRTSPVSSTELSAVLDSVRDSFRREDLPIDFRDAVPPPSPHQNRYVEQLVLIEATTSQLKWATFDYYRAREQRSKWLRDRLLALQELDNYDAILTEEWQRSFDDASDLHARSTADPIALGQRLYLDTSTRCRPIRTECTESYVGRGSLHLLADALTVGWHPDFRRLLSTAGLADSAGGTE